MQADQGGDAQAGAWLASDERLVASVQPLLQAFADNGYHFSDALVRAILMRAGKQ